MAASSRLTLTAVAPGVVAVLDGDGLNEVIGLPNAEMKDVDIAGDRRSEIVASVPDGFVYAVSPSGKRLWRYDYAPGAPKTFASNCLPWPTARANLLPNGAGPATA